MTDDEWMDPGQSTLGVFLAGDQLRSTDNKGERRQDTSYLLWLHAGAEPVDVHLPSPWANRYVEVLRTDRLDATDSPSHDAGATVRLDARTLALFEAVIYPSCQHLRYALSRQRAC